MNRASRLLMLACLAPLLACSEHDAATQRPLPEWKLKVEQRFGGEQLPLSFVTEMAIGPAGRWAVLDYPPDQVRLVQRDGTVIPIGRQGAGPAEYRYVNQIGFQGDTLWIAAAHASRVLYFDLQGTFLRSVGVRANFGGAYPKQAGPVRPLANGAWLVSESGISVDEVVDGLLRERTYAIYSRDSRLDTLFEVPLPAHDYMRVELGHQHFIEGLSPVPWAPLFIPLLDGRGGWVVDRAPPKSADPTDFTIRRIGLNGDTARSTSIRYKPVALSEKWKSEWYASFAATVSASGRMGTPRGKVIAALHEAIIFPKFFPPIREAQAGTDGRLWLRQWSPDSQRSEWLVIDSLGHSEGRLRAPDGFRLLAADSNEVFGVVKDSLDVPTVIRGVIEKAQRS